MGSFFQIGSGSPIAARSGFPIGLFILGVGLRHIAKRFDVRGIQNSLSVGGVWCKYDNEKGF